ncbi:MAG: NifU family protein [Kiritimatiellae bacterium]|nr:NifU family protein [Kiritimatiellia bacterium]
MEEQVKAYIEQIRPYIQSHGGDVEFVALQGQVVKLKLLGACRGCPGALMTLHHGIEAQLREVVNPDLSVERVD